MKIQYDSPTKKSGVDIGKCSFTLYWKTDYIPGLPYEKGNFRYTRAQCYFANPLEYGFPTPESVNFKDQYKENK